MAERCTGCTNKYGFREHPRLCPECRRHFCQSCLPHLPPDSKKKKKSEPLISVNPCVYCTKQRNINQVEDAIILENFEERFYKHSHTEPPIQTKLHQDISKGLPPNEEQVPNRLSEKDQALVERLKKLKESSTNPVPSQSEDKIRDRLAQLRGESDPGSAHSPPVSRGNTQVEQARDLIDKTTDEIRIDEKLEETQSKKDEELSQRLRALKGIKDTGSQAQEGKKLTIDLDAMFEDFELEIPEEDPELLLGDLRALQAKEEQLALAEAGQDDIQALIRTAKELAKEDQATQGDGDTVVSKLSGITYPNLDELEEGGKEKEEVARLVSDVMNEIEQEKEDVKYVEEASTKLLELHKDKPPDEELDEGDVVRSKLDYPPNLDVSWDHFGQQPGAARDGLPSAARQLGIQVSADEDPEVKRLIEKAEAEAALDRKLEASGFSIRPLQAAEEQSGVAKGQPGASRGDEDFPWCCICNADATIRCYDCDDDLYCTRCFSEGHEQFGLFDHHYAAYEPPRQ